jgi:hypothetical protein
MRAPPRFLTPKGLEHVGPRVFGYGLDFKSVFDEPPPARSAGFPPPHEGEG